MNVGDVISTAREAMALMVGAIVVDQRGDAFKAGAVTVTYMMRHGPLTVVALPGRMPRPERVVKAEALREAASYIRRYRFAEILSTSSVLRVLEGRADRIEAGEE